MFDARSILDALVRGGGGQSPPSSGPSRGDDIFRDLLGQLGGGGNVEPRRPMEDRDPATEARGPARDERTPPSGRAGDDERPGEDNNDDDHGEDEGQDDNRHQRDDRADARPPPGNAPTGGGSLEDILRDVLGGGSRPGSGGPGGGGGGLQDILRDILGGGQTGPGANRVFGEGGQGAGGGGNVLLDRLRQVLGQATSGVREGAGRLDEMTGASGRARDALGQATGQSPEELIAKLRDLIGNNRLATGAALGGLGALILGTGAGRSLAGSAVRLGGLALISGLAYKAYQNYQQGLPPLGGARPRAGAQQLVTAPSGSGFEPDAVTHEQALLYIRAMIAAASADGRIDAKEQQKISGGLQQAGLGGEAQRFLEGEMNNPATVEDLAASIASEQDAVQVYTAARIAIDLDNGAGARRSCSQLAEALDIDAKLAAQVDAAARAAA